MRRAGVGILLLVVVGKAAGGALRAGVPVEDQLAYDIHHLSDAVYTGAWLIVGTLLIACAAIRDTIRDGKTTR
jgi:hypothetical protein